MGRNSADFTGSRQVFALAALLLFAAPALATGSDSLLTLRAFGSLGYTRSSSGEAEYVRDLSQGRGSRGEWVPFVDSMLGVQANYQINDQAELVMQAVAREHDLGTFEPNMEWGFLRYAPTPSTTLRLGRVGTDFYLQADSRLVGFSNLAVRPAPEVFGTLPFFHIDGADITTTWQLGGGLLQGKLFAGVVEEKAPYATSLWEMGGSTIQGGNLDYRQGAWSFRAGYALLRLEQELPPYPSLASALRAVGAGGIADALSVAGRNSDFYSLSVTYEDGPVQVQGMLSHIQQEAYAYQDSDAGYLLAGYRLGRVTPYAGIAWSQTRGNGLDTSVLSAQPAATRATLLAAVNDALTFSHSHQTTWTLGLRWDFRRNMDLKVQWDGIRGQADSLMLTHDERAGWNGRTDVYSVALDFVF